MSAYVSEQCGTIEVGEITLGKLGFVIPERGNLFRGSVELAIAVHRAIPTRLQCANRTAGAGPIGTQQKLEVLVHGLIDGEHPRAST